VKFPCRNVPAVKFLRVKISRGENSYDQNSGMKIPGGTFKTLCYLCVCSFSKRKLSSTPPICRREIEEGKRKREVK
jgi:hypothetical protein